MAELKAADSAAAASATPGALLLGALRGDLATAADGLDGLRASLVAARADQS